MPRNRPPTSSHTIPLHIHSSSSRRLLTPPETYVMHAKSVPLPRHNVYGMRKRRVQSLPTGNNAHYRLERTRLSNCLFLAINRERYSIKKARQLARRPAPSVQKDSTASVGLACHGRSTATRAPHRPSPPELKIV